MNVEVLPAEFDILDVLMLKKDQIMNLESGDHK